MKAKMVKESQASVHVPFLRIYWLISSDTAIAKPIPLKCIPIAFVLFSKFSLTMTIAPPTIRTIAAPNPAMTLETSYGVSLVVVARTSVVSMLNIIPILKYFTLVLMSLINIEKRAPAK